MMRKSRPPGLPSRPLLVALVALTSLVSVASLGCESPHPITDRGPPSPEAANASGGAYEESAVDAGETFQASPAASSAAAPVIEGAPRELAGEIDAREATWSRLFDHIATSCYVDQLAPIEYAAKWLTYRHPRKIMLSDAPYPSRLNQVFPSPGSPGAKRRAQELRARWIAEPRSHVVDCSFSARRRKCSTCVAATSHRELRSYYVAYLPAALFREPERVRSLLLLVPGGNGDRSRAFLTPVPDRTIYDKGSGGLETKRRVDEHLSAHPSAEPLVIVSLQTNGDESINGSTEQLTYEVPNHIAEVVLGGVDRSELMVGAEGVSSGAGSVMRALYAKPSAFNTVGLTCMACGGVDPRTEHLAPRARLKEWSRVLSERMREGSLRVQFAIGSRDNQLPCNEAFYGMWSKAGLFGGSSPPTLIDCDPGVPPGARSCDAQRDGFRIYRGGLHDYDFLRRSYPAQLEWHIASLSEMRAARAGAQ